MKKIFLITLFFISTILRAENTSALLMVCKNLNQPDLKEITLLRENLDTDRITAYLIDSNNRMTLLSYTTEDFREGMFILPDFVGFERVLQREQDGWHVFIFYKNRVLDKLAECSEAP